MSSDWLGATVLVALAVLLATTLVSISHARRACDQALAAIAAAAPMHASADVGDPADQH